MSALRVDMAAEHDLPEWDRYICSQPQSTVYHLSAWRRIFGEALGYSSWFLIARNVAGDICGALPLYLVRGLTARRLVAVPFRDRGGPVFEGPEALDGLLARAQELAEQERSGLLLKTLAPLPNVQGTNALSRTDHWVRSRLRIAGLDRAALWERIGGKNRNMVRQAEQQGLRVTRTTMEDGAAQRWHRLHLESQHRLGVPPFPLGFFSLMLETLQARSSIEQLEVRLGDQLCAATLLLMHQDTCIYAYSASSREGQRMRANDMMLFEALILAAERNLAWFDFGSDSPLQESLLFFKRKWGAEQQRIPVYASRGASIADSSNSRYALARSVFRAMPAALSAWIGSRVLRRLG